jgi:DNA primase
VYNVISIRRSNPIEAVVVRSGVGLRAAGRRLVGNCPFHRDGRPSLAVYPANQSYFCFGCGAGGDVIDFVARLHGLGFKEAAAMLAGSAEARCGPDDAPRNVIRLPTPPRPAALTQVEAQVIDAAVSFYHDALWSSGDALAYLAARGVSPATARQCRLGFGCSGLAVHLRRRGLSLDAARRVGLISGERETMLGRIVIPDIRGGRTGWLTGRSVDGREPRYLNLRRATPLLGVDLVRSDEVVVTEGPFDWLTAVQWGLPAVALLGSRVSHSMVQALSRFRRVYLALDSDEAGRRAAAQLAAELDCRAATVELPSDVHDLNDLGRLPDGREAFLRCLEEEEANDGKERLWDSNDTALSRAPQNTSSLPRWKTRLGATRRYSSRTAGKKPHKTYSSYELGPPIAAYKANQR